MNDPDSFEHVSTRYYDLEEYLIIDMNFRGNNAFGATVIDSVRARVDVRTGEILEILE